MKSSKGREVDEREREKKKTRTLAAAAERVAFFSLRSPRPLPPTHHQVQADFDLAHPHPLTVGRHPGGHGLREVAEPAQEEAGERGKARRRGRREGKRGRCRKSRKRRGGSGAADPANRPRHGHHPARARLGDGQGARADKGGGGRLERGDGVRDRKGGHAVARARARARPRPAAERETRTPIPLPRLQQTHRLLAPARQIGLDLGHGWGG